MANGNGNGNHQKNQAAYERIAGLEEGYRALTRDVGSLAETVAQLQRDQRHSFDMLSEKLSATKQTDWKLIVSFVSIFLTITGALVYGIQQQDGQLKEQIGQSHNTLGKAIVHQDEVLQREMRILDDRQQEKMDGFQNRVLSELNRREDMFQRILTWQEGHDKEVSATNARQDTDLAWIKKEMEKNSP